MSDTKHSRREFLQQAVATAVMLANADGEVIADAANKGNLHLQEHSRTLKILAEFEGIQEDYERLKGEIADMVRVSLDLAPELLLPGEDVVLAMEARSTSRPNPKLEVLADIYEENQTRSTFTLDWKRDAASGRYRAGWRWRPPHTGNYQIRWLCDVGGDVPEFRRNFSVVDRGWAVMIVNTTSNRNPLPQPDFHALSLPFSYWQEVSLFARRRTVDDFTSVSRNARQYGDDPGLMIFLGGEYIPGDQTVWYDEPEEVQRTVMECYQKVWPMHRFPQPVRSLYTYGMGNVPMRIARSMGYNLLGALCADQNWQDGQFKINDWGMPARPYFVSREDFRKPGDGGHAAMVGVQQCERQTVECRDYNCVYSFESGVEYALDMYTGVTRTRIVNDMILSREIDFLECFIDASEHSKTPYFFSCGFEFNGVWPQMAAINRHFMEHLVQRARGAKVAYTTATATADFLRRHYMKTPETTLYLPDVYAGITINGKPAAYPDTMEMENDQIKAIFRRGEMLPYALYDYTTRWDYPDWGNAGIPRDKQGYIIPNTDDRFRVTPRIVDTRGFNVSSRTEDDEQATRVTILVEAIHARRNLALGVWDLPRVYTSNSERFHVSGAARFIPIRAPYTGNLNGVLVADVKPGGNRFVLTVTTPRRKLRSQDIRLGEHGFAKVFETAGGGIAYLFSVDKMPEKVEIRPLPVATASLYSPDSDEGRPLSDPVSIHLTAGNTWRLTGMTYEQVLQACPSAMPVAIWTISDAIPPRKLLKKVSLCHCERFYREAISFSL